MNGENLEKEPRIMELTNQTFSLWSRSWTWKSPFSNRTFWRAYCHSGCTDNASTTCLCRGYNWSSRRNIDYIRRTSGDILTVQESRGLPDEITVEIKGTSSQVQLALEFNFD
ncbi:uncharacterized protein [Henckelia pumila]|uniref:uncharacterized protein isoform X2 n=1 Tax=Henckelia pumila TaxID=405737 RepID=UPI003C6E3565